jgi:porin
MVLLSCGCRALAWGGDFEEWWAGKRAGGDLFGVREELRDTGLTLDGRWRGVYFGVVDSSKGSGSAFAQELSFGANLDMAKFLEQRWLEGLAGFGAARWRDPGAIANPNRYVEAAPLFNPSRYAGGTGWRLLSFGLRYQSGEVGGIDGFATLAGGWLRPRDEFLDQPLQGLFVNNAIASAEGIGGNVPFTGSFSTWGGTLQIKAADWQYTKLGLFMSFPQANDSANHGLAFEGYGPAPSQNGLYFLGETGAKPELGPAKLPGHYAFGGYFYQDGSTASLNRFGLYWQIDQMLWRESDSSEDAANDAVDGLPIVDSLERRQTSSSEGLRFFSLLLYAPESDNVYSFYAHGGLIYEGLLPGRGADQLISGVAFGNYGARSLPGATSTTLIEIGYRIRLNGWAFVQPYAQYFVQPNGTASVRDAAVLGVFVGADF